MENILCEYSDKIDIKKTTIKVNDIKERFKGPGIGPHNVSFVLVSIMKEASKLKKLTGSEKKNLVTRLLGYLIEELVPDGKEELEHILKAMVPSLIDNIIDIGKTKTFKKSMRLLCF